MPKSQEMAHFIRSPDFLHFTGAPGSDSSARLNIPRLITASVSGFNHSTTRSITRDALCFMRSTQLKKSFSPVNNQAYKEYPSRNMRERHGVNTCYLLKASRCLPFSWRKWTGTGSQVNDLLHQSGLQQDYY